MTIIRKKVEDLQVGDLVDLQSCPYLNNQPSAEFEYAEVCEVQQETPGCVAVYYDGMAAGYPTGTILDVYVKR